MQRLANFDIGRKFDRFPLTAVQIAFGGICAAAMIVARLVIDSIMPGAGPFALVYPAILVATLYGRWRAGLVTYIVTLLWVWYFVLPPTRSFTFTYAADHARLLLNAASALMVLVLAEAFRKAVRVAAQERDRQIVQSEMLHSELEHRTKNNFQLMLSLLHLQRRQEADEASRQALSLAARRVTAFANAHAHLPVAPSAGAEVPMRPYLLQLVDEVARAVFDDRITVHADIAEASLERPQAMAIGLFANEAMTNCAKHAFPPGRHGRVSVVFAMDAEKWVLLVRDDGVGGKSSPEGTGSALMKAFAKQAGATYRIGFSNDGCVAQLYGSK